MQSLDRLIMNELEAMDALDEGFDDGLDSFWDDAIDEALNEASPVRLPRQLPMRPAMARRSLQRSIVPSPMTSRPQARQLASSTSPTAGGFRSALFQEDPDLLAVLNGQLRLGRPGDRQYPAPIKSQGTGVLKVQQALVQLGYPTGRDGKYGNQTYNTVLNYKRRYGILTETGYLDGIVGSKTIRHLDNALASSNLSPPLSTACCPINDLDAQTLLLTQKAKTCISGPQPKLSFYQYYFDNMKDTNGFKNVADGIANKICAIDGSSYHCGGMSIASTPYMTGESIISSITYAYECIKAKGIASPHINEVHICSHSGAGGLYSQFHLSTCGLYVDAVWGDVDRSCGARTVSDLPFYALSENVVFVLRGCDTAKKGTRFMSCFAENLFQVLQSHGKYSAKVYGHPDRSTYGSVAGNSNWIEFSSVCLSGRRCTSIGSCSGSASPVCCNQYIGKC